MRAPSTRLLSQHRAVVAALFAALAAASSAHGYPIPPSTIWELGDQSDAIVLATVVEDGREARDAIRDEANDDWIPARARLAVRAVWKGRAGREIEVAYEPNLLCPAPARFEEGETVLAFLGWDEDESRWYVPELSYGTLYPRSEDVAAFRRLVDRALFLQRSSSAVVAPPLDWLVEAVSRRGTRWHGLYGLASRFDRLHSFYDSEQKGHDLRAALSRRQLARIAKGFVAEPSADITFPMTLAVLAGVEDEAVDRIALRVFEGVLRRESAPYWIEDAMARILERFGDAGAAERGSTYEGNFCVKVDLEQVRAQWREAKLLLAIPEVAPLVPVPDAVWGVGGTTPD